MKAHYRRKSDKDGAGILCGGGQYCAGARPDRVEFRALLINEGRH
jgi:hypothetical protein